MGFVYHYEMNELIIKREKAAARELRKSRWWQSKIATRAKCHYCQKSLQKIECTMDHVVPIVRGGRSTKGNIVVSCKECNNAKKDRLIIDWASYRTDTEPSEESGGLSTVAGFHEPGDKHQEQ